MSPAHPVKKRIPEPREGKKETRKPKDFTVGRAPAATGRTAAGRLRLEDAAFALSVHDPRELPPPGAPEVAFAGRSNAGKSSAINTLAGRRRLAFVSKTPGRTQLINFFALGPRGFLVDLPGYGYAGVPLAVRQHWESLVGDYVGRRETLAGVVVVMDARHPLTSLDRELLSWLAPAGRPIHVLLTKADKLSRQAATATLARVRKELAALYPGAGAQLFSSLKREGIGEVGAVLAAWISGPEKTRAPAKGE